MLSIRTVWVTRHAGHSPAFDVFPPVASAGPVSDEALYVTNEPLAFEDLFPAGRAGVVDGACARLG